MTQIFKGRSENSHDDWATPEYFFKLLDDEFHFTLDPCASERNHKCAKYYTEETNGLLQSWKGEVCFVNPPFNAKETWIRKSLSEVLNPNTTVVMIIPAFTDTKVWHECVMLADEIRFCIGRVNFIPPEIREKKASSNFPLAIVVFRNPTKYKELRVSSFRHKD